MKRTFALAAVAGLTLAACGSGGSENKTSGNTAAAEAAPQGSASASGAGSAGAPAKITPGLYETSVSMKIGGLPAEMAKAMEGSVEKKQECVTPEEAAKGSADLFGDKSEDCQSKDVVFAGGKIHGTLVCSGKGSQGNSTMTLDGSYTATTFDVTGKAVVQADGKQMTIDTHIAAQRIGDCKADAKEG